MVEDPKANVSLPLWGFAHACASLYDKLVLKLLESQLVHVNFMFYLKGRNCMSLNDLIPSLYAKSFESIGILIDDSTLDDAFTLDAFLYYLFAYDDIHASLGFVL